VSLALVMKPVIGAGTDVFSTNIFLLDEFTLKDLNCMLLTC